MGLGIRAGGWGCWLIGGEFCWKANLIKEFYLELGEFEY